MENRILVAYATKYGATSEIAARIGQVLEKRGLNVTVLPIAQVDNPSAFKAIVLGSAVYIGRWRKKAAKFLKENESELAKKPVWFFSSGPTGEGDPETLMKGWRFPEKLQPIADRIAPRDIRLFSGAIDKSKLTFIEKWMIKKVKAPIGDFRNWEAITSWSLSIAGELEKMGFVKEIPSHNPGE